MDAFEKAGYGVGDIGWGARPAVVAVDFQLAFTSDEYSFGGGEHITAAVQRGGEVAAAARAAGVLVIHTAVGWSTPAEFGRWKVPALAGIRPGSPAAGTDPAVWDAGDVYLLKRYPSAFFGTDLVSILQRNGVDTVLVMGATTSGCVRATVVDSFSYGFRTIAVGDACGDQSVDAHEANLRDVRRRYADVIDSAEAIAGIGRYSEREAVS